MLCLTRKRGERLVLVLPDGSQVAIELRGAKRAKLVVDAPAAVRVVRQELLGRETAAT